MSNIDAKFNRHMASAVLRLILLGVLATSVLPTAAHAQKEDMMEGVMGARPAEGEKSRVGGHIGVVFPIVSRGDGQTTTISDDFVVGFPIGITIRNSSPIAFDFEFIPAINNSPSQNVTLTIHPGVIYGFKKKYAAGIRAAFDVGDGTNTYGFTPLISRGFKLKGKTGYFVEADFPVRFRQRPDGTRSASGGFAAHFGFSF